MKFRSLLIDENTCDKSERQNLKKKKKGNKLNYMSIWQTHYKPLNFCINSIIVGEIISHTTHYVTIKPLSMSSRNQIDHSYSQHWKLDFIKLNETIIKDQPKPNGSFLFAEYEILDFIELVLRNADQIIFLEEHSVLALIPILNKFA